jgi:two-component system response regulator YesN
VFKVTTGFSLKQYMKLARMARAKELLDTTGMSVKEITFEVGLICVSHFVRDFKKTYGATPQEWRKVGPRRRS